MAALDGTAEKRGPFAAQYGPYALVTGASDGIGAAFARELAPKGIDLIVTARREDRLVGLAKELREAHGTTVHVIPLDLADRASPQKLIAFANDYDVGLLVNCAGFGTSGPFLTTSTADETSMLDVNCLSSLLLTKAFAPKMAARKRGGIILMSSIVAFQGAPWSANYAATKSYIQTLAEGLASELKSEGVHVLAVAPGPVRTGFAARADMVMEKADAPQVVARGGLAALGRTTTVRPGFLSKFLGHSLAILPRAQRVRVMRGIMGGMTKHQPPRTAALTAD